MSCTINPFVHERNKVVGLMHADSVNKDKYKAVYDSLTLQIMHGIELNVKLHPNSYAAFHQFISFSASFLHSEWKKKIYPSFSEQIKNSKEGKRLFYTLFEYNVNSIIGSDFPDISTSNTNKQKLQLELHKDTIYLIDYWASWCVPCIKKVPQLKQLYQKYHTAGFEIISLSLDTKYEAWIKSIHMNKIIWQNYSSLNGFDTEDVAYFNAKSIPFTILVGKNKKIVQINPTEEEVEQYLNKMF